MIKRARTWNETFSLFALRIGLGAYAVAWVIVIFNVLFNTP